MSIPEKTKLPVAVERPTPYHFDLGLLLANDPNPLELDAANKEESLKASARDAAQSLINQLLTTCAITSSNEGVLLSLPSVATPLPRAKPVPAPKPETKWEAFAKKKGIAPKTREQRRNLQFNEKSGDWERKWGYNAANKAAEREPIMEVDMRKEAERKEGTSVRGDARRQRKENVKRNERLERRNLRRPSGSK